jgi:hypothetical protein
MATVWASDSNVDEAASYLDLTQGQIRTAIRYTAEFPDEIRGQNEANEQAADRAQSEWEREQEALRR